MIFQIQDSDRPMFVLAADWGEALKKWQTRIVEENPPDPGSTNLKDFQPQPQGITMVAEDEEIIL